MRPQPLCALDERPERARVQVSNLDARNGRAVPMPAHLTQQEGGQRRAAQLLLGAAAAHVVLAAVADGRGRGFYADLYQRKPLLPDEPHRRNDAEQIPRLVWNLLE